MNAAPPARVRVGDAVLLPGARLLRGPASEVRMWPSVARLIARLAAADGALVPRHALAEALYPPAVEPGAEDGGFGVLHAVTLLARRALRDVGAGVGIATVAGAGMRLDPAAAGGAVVHRRRDRARLLAAHADRVSGADLAERFGFASANSAHVVVSRARRRLRAEAAADGGGVP